MNSPPGERRLSPRRLGQHLATISHQGRFWDVYLELEEGSGGKVVGRLAFSPADGAPGEEPVRTATIIIEPDLEQAAARARSFEERDLVALLRSCLP